MKERAWTILCFLMGAVGFGCILVLNWGIAVFDALLSWFYETKRLVKEQWKLKDF